MSMTKLGHIPSPYGVPIAVYRDKGGGEDEFHHDLDGCMTMAGVHGKRDRDRCKAALEAAMGRGGVPFQIFLDHGGRKVSHLSLPRPLTPTYPELIASGAAEEDIPIEAWVTTALDHMAWDTRAAAFLDIIEGNMKAASGWEAPSWLIGHGLSITMSAALEHLPDKAVDCLEAAAFYSLSCHETWRAVGVEWLRPIHDTWFHDWTRARPGYLDFARRCAGIYSDLPEWIGGAA